MSPKAAHTQRRIGGEAPEIKVLFWRGPFENKVVRKSCSSVHSHCVIETFPLWTLLFNFPPLKRGEKLKSWSVENFFCVLKSWKKLEKIKEIIGES